VGWRGAIRDLNAASNRAERARQRHNGAVVRGAQKELRALEQGYERALAKAASFEEKVLRDPIKALALRWAEREGVLHSDPFEIEAGPVSGRLFLLGGRDEGAAPAAFSNGTWVVEGQARLQLLHMAVAAFATVLVVRVECLAPTGGVRLDLVRKSDLRSSPLFLVDRENGDYLYPLATDLSGKVVPGAPRVGLVAFEPFRAPTGAVEVHLSDATFGLKGASHSFCATVEAPTWRPFIARQLAEDGLAERVEAELDRLVTRRANEIEVAAKGALRRGGCAGLLGLGAALAGSGPAWWWFSA